MSRIKKELYTWISSSYAKQAVLAQSRFFGENRIPEKRVPYRVRRMYLRCSSDERGTEMALAMFIIFLRATLVDMYLRTARFLQNVFVVLGTF